MFVDRSPVLVQHRMLRYEVDDSTRRRDPGVPEAPYLFPAGRATLRPDGGRGRLGKRFGPSGNSWTTRSAYLSPMRKRLFEDGGVQKALKLVDSKTFSTGVLYLTYQPAVK